MNGIPMDIRNAMELDFGIPITGYLFEAFYSPPVIIGTVYRDSRGRFADGSAIHTSALWGTVSLMGYPVVQTITGSIYVIVSWQAQGSDLHTKRTYH